MHEGQIAQNVAEISVEETETLTGDVVSMQIEENETITEQPGAGQNQTKQERSQTIQEFRIGSDDYGFYLNGQKITSLVVNKGNLIKITLVFDPKNIYYSDVNGQGLDVETVPNVFTIKYRKAQGQEEHNVEFSTQESFKVTSYWPNSEVKKADLFVNVV